MTLGERIQKLRREGNLTQKELAEKLNTSTADVAVWESDESVPAIADIVKLSLALGVTTDVLIMDSEITDDETLSNSQEDGVENEVQPIGAPCSKISKSFKKKLAVLISISVIVVVIIGVFAYKLFLPFSKDTAEIEKAASSVVKIYCYDHEGNESATGSGFIAFNNRTVVTNYHVMENAYTCKVSTDEDKTYEVESILAYSKEQDIAIIELKESTGLRVLSLGKSEGIKKGETIIAIGSPLGIKNTVSQGVLSGRLMENSIDVLQFTAPISSGSSGGALFDDSGKVIGITYASLIDGQNLNLAIPIEFVKILDPTKGTIMVNDISEIYLQAHPDVKYSMEYEDAVAVTFVQLKQNPSLYNGKIIKITTYVSSVNPDIDYEDGRVCYISNRDNVSGDNNHDRSVNILAMVNGSNKYSGIIAVNVSSSYGRYYDKAIAVGDEINIIGKFNYVKHDSGTVSESIDAEIIY